MHGSAVLANIFIGSQYPSFLALLTSCEKLYCIMPARAFMFCGLLYLLLFFMPSRCSVNLWDRSLCVIFRSAFFFVFDWVIFLVNYPSVVSCFLWFVNLAQTSPLRISSPPPPPPPTFFVSHFLFADTLPRGTWVKAHQEPNHNGWDRAPAFVIARVRALPILGFTATWGVGEVSENRYQEKGIRKQVS